MEKGIIPLPTNNFKSETRRRLSISYDDDDKLSMFETQSREGEEPPKIDDIETTDLPDKLQHSASKKVSFNFALIFTI